MRINDYLGKMHIFSSSYLLSNSSEEIYGLFFFQVTHIIGDLAYLSNFLSDQCDNGKPGLSNIILFNSNNWSIDLFGIVTRKFAPRTIGRWCENIKIIVDFGAFDPSAVIIFLRD